MPIANCIVTSECMSSDTDLIELWSKESGQSSESMTVNILFSAQQLGNKYRVMATLHLPSLWSESAISSLQLGLAQALSTHYSLPLDEVFVITNIVESGRVVEAGKEERW